MSKSSNEWIHYAAGTRESTYAGKYNRNMLKSVVLNGLSSTDHMVVDEVLKEIGLKSRAEVNAVLRVLVGEGKIETRPVKRRIGPEVHGLEMEYILKS